MCESHECHVTYNLALKEFVTRLRLNVGITRYSYFSLSLLTRHPMALSLVLKARKFSDVCFVTDSVMEGRCGTTARYSGREGTIS